VIEKIFHNNMPLAYIIQADFTPAVTTFLTPEEFNQQVGYIVYPSNSEIARHVHLPVERHTVGTSEVLVVKKGHCVIDIYNDDRALVVSRELTEGDVVILITGGHGFRMIEDTVLLEIKQGPHISQDEKERF
jgi:hypothetical protein